jgi:hypothetical protein
MAMGMFDLLLGRKPASAGKPRNSKTGNSTQFGASQMTQGGPASVNSIRKDLLRVAMRETLTRNGIPPGWVSADMLRTNSAKKEAGMHVRFLVRHWEPRLLLHGVALEQDFLQRLLTLDPQAHDWMAGFSWQFALEDTSACPPLPHPGAWIAPLPTVPEHTAPASMHGPITQGGIIEGPPMLPARPIDEVRADLERLLAVRDQDMKRQAESGDPYAPTRPAGL